jgi:hypothetical protein
MTKDEFKRLWLEDAGMSAEQFESLGFIVMQCVDCTHETCEGFQVVHRSTIEAHS